MTGFMGCLASTKLSCAGGEKYGWTRWRRFVAGVCAVLCAGGAEADEVAQPQTVAPAPELLEFLAEFGQLDKQTFELIVFHGLDDADKQRAHKTAQSQAKPDQSEAVDHD